VYVCARHEEPADEGRHACMWEGGVVGNGEVAGSGGGHVYQRARAAYALQECPAFDMSVIPMKRTPGRENHRGPKAGETHHAAFQMAAGTGRVKGQCVVSVSTPV